MVPCWALPAAFWTPRGRFRCRAKVKVAIRAPDLEGGKRPPMHAHSGASPKVCAAGGARGRGRAARAWRTDCARCVAKKILQHVSCFASHPCSLLGWLFPSDEYAIPLRPRVRRTVVSESICNDGPRGGSTLSDAIDGLYTSLPCLPTPLWWLSSQSPPVTPRQLSPARALAFLTRAGGTRPAALFLFSRISLSTVVNSRHTRVRVAH